MRALTTRRMLAQISKSRTIILIFAIIFAVYLFSSFDVCWFTVPRKSIDKGFVFGSGWTEHLHSSEEWAIFYQVDALYHGRAWLSQYVPPNFTVDICKVGDYYFALVEPITAFFLLPFYALGQLFLGGDYLVRSALFGMIFYTTLNALLIRKISLQLNQTKSIANAAALLFAFATMAFSYSRLLYPQPIVTLLMLTTIFFLFDYKKTQTTKNLFGSFLFYGLTVASFNAFIITAPFFLYYLFENGYRIKRNVLLKGALAIIPSILIFVIWNYTVTGNPIMTPRQVGYSSINFQVLYTTEGGAWLNLEGLVGTLFSPVGILFVSPILFASLLGFSSLRSRAKKESLLLASIIIVFWLFVSFANLGGVAGRDWWIGGWANIARYMYVPSALLSIFAAGVLESVIKKRSLLGAWLISLAMIFSFLANLSYGIRHDTMVGLAKDFVSTSLLIWPYQLESSELAFLTFSIILISLLFPIYLFMRYKHHDFLHFQKNHEKTSARADP